MRTKGSGLWKWKEMMIPKNPDVVLLFFEFIPYQSGSN